VLQGVSKVFIQVEDQERALEFWTQMLGFELLQDAAYGERRWIELRTPDGAVIVVLGLREGEGQPVAPETVPTSNVAFYCNDLEASYKELVS